MIMATVVIQKREGKNGMSYSIRYAHPITGEKKYFKTLRRYKAAQQEANDLRALLTSGNIPRKGDTKLNPLTFSEVAASLRKEWELRLKEKRLSPKTYFDYSSCLNRLERSFGRRILCQITEAELIDFRKNEIEKNSVISANRYLIITKFVFKHGKGLKAVIQNPSENIRLLSEKGHERKKYLLPNELDDVIKVSRSMRAKFYLPAIICLGAEHGASKQEILSLEWKHIDFDFQGKGLIYFHRTKNDKDRTAFLMPRTKKTLLEWHDHLTMKRRRENIRDIKSDRVFCRIDGTPLESFGQSWRNVLEIAGVKDFHFHDLRHTYCSNLLLSGASLKDVKEMIGHSDISMTDRYSHLSLQHQQRVQEQLANHYLHNEKKYRHQPWNDSRCKFGTKPSKSIKKAPSRCDLSA